MMLSTLLLTLLQGSVSQGRPYNERGRFLQTDTPGSSVGIRPRGQPVPGDHWRPDWLGKEHGWAPRPTVIPTPESNPYTAAPTSTAEAITTTITATLDADSDPYIEEPTSTTSIPAVITSFVPFGTVQILPGHHTPFGGIIPSLDPWGHITDQPLLTETIPTPTSTLPTVSTLPPTPETTALEGEMTATNIFAHPVATDAPSSAIPKRKDHPAPRVGINGTGPFETNKFYANFFLGNQTSPTYLHPYSVAWSKGKGASASWGLAISHINATQRVYGQANNATGAATYFINPVGIQSITISAKELGANTTLTTDLLTASSVRVSLRPDEQAPPTIQFPLVQGSAFVTAVFNGGCPLFQTGVFYHIVTRATKEVKPGITKYKLHLEDGSTWILYAYHTKGDALDLEVVNNNLARSKKAFYGIIQVAKDPGNGEALYDEACGVYPTCADISGSVDGSNGKYKFTFQKAGMINSTLAMFALPHHVASFDDATQKKVTEVKLQTTTKGVATAVLADSWTMVEKSLPVDIGFVPWVPKVGSVGLASNDTRDFIHNIAQQEISQNMIEQSDQNSMYFSGKALAKFATILIAINDMVGDQVLAQSGLKQLKIAFARFSENKQQYPLVYESAWGGVVSSATYHSGDSGADFGNTYYNDHHFHYGYFIYTAAVIGHLDPSWIPDNKAYVDMLVRDVANPSINDTYFPVWRCFDWYHGHSWAHGLFETLDGKDQESSSEDTMHAYAIKMWGTISGDKHMAARGNLMLAVQARSMQSYYLYTKHNTVQPVNFIGNKVAGILFENKVDHTTYFGGNTEYIQGIHMLPLLPHTPLVRTPDFVAEEWNTYFGNGRADEVVGGWKGILFGNYATIDPRGAYKFFSQPKFDPSWLDGGASLTWYLCYSAAFGGL